MLFQFVGAAIGASIVMTFASFLWPKVTSEPRPEALTRMRDVVIHTTMGQRLADVLGVSDETQVTQVSIGDTVTYGTNAVIDTISKSAQRAVTAKLLETLGSQFNNLSEEDKIIFRTQICEPSVQ